MKQIRRVMFGLLIALLIAATAGRALGAPAADLRLRPAGFEIGQPIIGESYGCDGRDVALNRRDRSQQRAGSADFCNYNGFVRSASGEFTAKLRDYESGLNLDYFGARYFFGAMGRFVSADAPFADQHAENPQPWNLYSCTLNNPVCYIDDDGRGVKEGLQQAVDDIGIGIGMMTMVLQPEKIVFGAWNAVNHPVETANRLAAGEGVTP